MSAHIIRLRRSYWSDRRGVHCRISLTWFRRSMPDGHLLEIEADQVGAQQAMEVVTNMHECSDGLYYLQMHKCSYDNETGYLDDYKLRLVPVESGEPAEQPIVRGLLP